MSGSDAAHAWRQGRTGRGWIERVAVWSSAHPWTALTVWALAVVVMFGVSLVVDTRHATDTEMLTGEAQRAAQLAEDAGLDEPAVELVLLTRADDAAWAQDEPALAAARDRVAATAHVDDVVGPIPSADGTAALLQVSIDGDPETAAERVGPLRETVAALSEELPDVTVEQTGAASIAEDFQGWLGDALDRAAAISVPATLLILLNIASTLASFGVLVLLFQGTWAEGVLGFTSNGHLVSWVPLMLFVVLSGLSLDYHVLVLNRIRENARQGMPAEAAVLEGTTRTASVVTSAAAIMIVVFAVFGTLSFVELKQIGVGLAIATLLDVTIVRVLALPAALLSARRMVWWRERTDSPGGLAVAAGEDGRALVQSRA